MKPTSPTSRPARHHDSARALRHTRNSALVTDWSFQAAPPEIRGGGSASFPEPAFRSLGDSFFASEAKKESRLEGALFGMIVAIAAWPIGLAVHAAFALMK